MRRPPFLHAVRRRPYAGHVKVVGIDPGTAACGYGVVDAGHGRLRAVDHGCWRTASGLAPEQRLKRIYDGVSELIALHDADAVALEESFVGPDARTALSVGQARGAVLVACAVAGLESREYSPNRVKSMVCGYGHADKGQVQRMVKTMLGLSEVPRPHHAADALAVAICHALAPPLVKVVAG
jgi:crossover junction endodeoxyribonuclease RuvC